MGKKRATTTRRQSRPKTDNDEVDAPTIDEDPAVDQARDHLEQAREALREAEKQYQQVRTDAAKKYEQLRDTSVGDVVDGTLEFVRKHPGTGLIAASAVGFFIGRIFRRLF